MRGIALVIMASLVASALTACGNEDDVQPDGASAPAATDAVAAAPTVETPQPVAVAGLTNGRAVSPTPYQGSVPPRVVVTAEPSPTSTGSEVDCSSFDTPDEAQLFFLDQGGPLEDRHRMDTNGDGLACNGENDAGFGDRRWVEAVSAGVSPRTTPEPEITPTPVHAVNPGHPTAILATQTVNNVPAVEATPTPEPLELWEVDWAAMEEGRLVEVVEMAGALPWTGLIESGGAEPPRHCVPQIGTMLDSSNPTWNEEARRAWMWVAPPGDGPAFCVGAIWSTRVKVFPIPVLDRNRDTFHHRPFDDRRALGIGQPLVFPSDYELNDYTFPAEPPHFGGAPKARDPIPAANPSVDKPYEEVQTPAGETQLYCSIKVLPSAIWTVAEGFVPLTLDEERRYGQIIEDAEVMNLQLSGEEVEVREEARKLGWYFVFPEEGDTRAYCWRVGNPEEVAFDVRPCLECYKRR